MKAYIFNNQRVIDPFGDNARDCLIANQPLRQIQVAILNRLGLEPVFVDNFFSISDRDEYIVLGDNLYFTEELIREFLVKSRLQQASTTCALKAGTTTRLTGVSLQENIGIHSDYVAYDLHYWPSFNFRDRRDVVIIDPDELSFSIPMPRHLCGADEYFVPFTDTFLIQIDHWVNLWAANVFTTVYNAVRLQKASKLKQLFLALKARSLNKWDILRRTNRIGSNCDVHPTAYIEGSIIGDNVIIGAGAVIRNSIIGNNVNLGNGVVVEESVIGEKSTIFHGHIVYSVFYPSSFSTASFVTATMIGRETFLGGNSSITDFRFDNRNVTVMQNGVPIDSGHRFLGSCLGHRTYFAANAVIAPGRTIPGDLKIALGDDKFINKITPDLKDPNGFRLV